LQRQEERGLGIKNLRKMNISLLCKWWWILKNENGLWQELVKLKYVHDSPVCLIKPKMNDSPCWKDLMKIRPIYLAGRAYKINNGKLVSFWQDPWLGTLSAQSTLFFMS
jgi:hypothetical protein